MKDDFWLDSRKEMLKSIDEVMKKVDKEDRFYLYHHFINAHTQLAVTTNKWKIWLNAHGVLVDLPEELLRESFKKFVRLVRALIEFDKEFTEKVPDDLVPNPQQQQQPSNPLTM